MTCCHNIFDLYGHFSLLALRSLSYSKVSRHFSSIKTTCSTLWFSLAAPLPSATGARLSQLVFLHRLPRRSTHVNNFCLSLPHLSTLLLLMFSDLLALAITCQELVDVEEVGENNARSQLLSAMDPVKPPPPHRVVLTPCCQCRSSPPPPLPPLSAPPPTPMASAWCHSTLSR